MNVDLISQAIKIKETGSVCPMTDKLRMAYSHSKFKECISYLPSLVLKARHLSGSTFHRLEDACTGTGWDSPKFWDQLQKLNFSNCRWNFAQYVIMPFYCE